MLPKNTNFIFPAKKSLHCLIQEEAKSLTWKNVWNPLWKTSSHYISVYIWSKIAKNVCFLCGMHEIKEALTNFLTDHEKNH